MSNLSGVRLNAGTVTQLDNTSEGGSLIEDLSVELLVKVFVFLDGISQHVLRRVNTRWNQVLRSYPVTRFTTLVRLEPQSSEVEWWSHMLQRCTARASEETSNLIVVSVRNRLDHCLNRAGQHNPVHLEDFWPNLRTLSICNGQISTLGYHNGNTNAPLEQFISSTFALESQHSTKFHATLQRHQLHQFGRLVTPKLRWIVLRNVDIDNLLMLSGGWSKSPVRCEVITTANPYNGSKVMNVVRTTNEPAVLVTVRHSFFRISFDENADQKILDILERDCEPAYLEERMAFCHRMNSWQCPHIDWQKGPLLRNLGRFEPSMKDITWEAALLRIAEWRNITFRGILSDGNSFLTCGTRHEWRPFFCCREAYAAYTQRNSERRSGPADYEEAILAHYALVSESYRLNPMFVLWRHGIDRIGDQGTAAA